MDGGGVGGGGRAMSHLPEETVKNKTPPDKLRFTPFPEKSR